MLSASNADTDMKHRFDGRDVGDWLLGMSRMHVRQSRRSAQVTEGRRLPRETKKLCSYAADRNQHRQTVHLHPLTGYSVSTSQHRHNRHSATLLLGTSHSATGHQPQWSSVYQGRECGNPTDGQEWHECGPCLQSDYPGMSPGRLMDTVTM